MKYVIEDWAGNTCFGGKTFESFNEAWGFLYEKFEGLSHNEFGAEMGEYEVTEVME
jgi:hypothetical protein